ncbi:unnamed protein product [Rotaria sp. Silwood2]|nr:unnamed protein product [Rotaria sp. Silwood2]CAF4218493.1 unnamed protein product [Rotaria sp. Silwood2]
MIQYVIEEEARLRQIASYKADNCQRVIDLLKQRACNLLSELVLSNNADLQKMEQLVQLKANCYQEQEYGPLGLLGKLLNQNKNPIRLDIVRFLVETDEDGKFALTKIDDQQQTCLSLSRKHSESMQGVTDYLQQQLDAFLNKIPFTHPEIDVNEVAHWIRRGANPEAIDEDQNTVLLNAVLANNVDLTRVLVANGCNTNHPNKANKTPLQIAKSATERNARLIAVLREQKVSNQLGQLISEKKSQLRKEEIYDYLEKGANINARIKNSDSFLHHLITNDGAPEMVTAFVSEFNADIFATNNQGLRPIEVCILHDKKPFTVLRTFLKLPRVSTDVLFNDISKKSIHQFAIEQDLHESAYIIQKELNTRLWICLTNATPNDDRNQSILSEARKLVDYGAEIDHRHNENDQYNGWSVLHVACKTTTKSFIKYLVQNLKASCALKNSNGDYPISIAAKYNQLEIVQTLRECRHVELNVFNNKYDTPLHLAAENHHYRTVRYLVLWGANEEARNSANETPLVSARRSQSRNKEEQIEKERTVEFLQKLAPSKDYTTREGQMKQTTPITDLDTCELVTHIDVHEIHRNAPDHKTKNGIKLLVVVDRGLNDKLHVAAKNGNVSMFRQAMDDGADICYLQNGRSPYKVAKDSAAKYIMIAESKSTSSKYRRKFCTMVLGCQQIADELLQLGRTQLIESIKQSNPDRVMAYCECGIQITPELLNIACMSSDNVEIIDYLIKKDRTVYEAMYNYTTSDSPYHLAKKNKFNRVANYIKYRLSIDCTEAIKKNDLELVKRLIRAGANVDLADTNNLIEALCHKNALLVQTLCENGAKIPSEWLQSDSVVLPASISEEMNDDIAFTINRNLIDRRLRLAAATGDFDLLVKCQRLGADINSKNCRGSTALLCTIQYGDYVQIVRSLVSRGATMLHSNEDEPMSVIELCKQKNYTEIEQYLTMQLGSQFSTSIIDDDRQSAAAFAALGANFNYQDEQQRTPLHYAVQYHGIDLVAWLCERGSNPMSADRNGDYAITLAAEKGIIFLFIEAA